MRHPFHRRATAGRRPEILGLATFLVAATTTAQPPGEYRIEAQIDMPHLRDNLKGTDTTDLVCVERAGDLFPALSNPVFAQCNLGREERLGRDSLRLLTCSGAGGTAGAALVRRDSDEVQAVLVVRMGGKNMTFSQRVQGQRRGTCPAAP